MSKLSFREQLEHSSYGVLGLLVPTLILTTYGGSSAYVVLAAVGLANVVGVFEGKALYKDYRSLKERVLRAGLYKAQETINKLEREIECAGIQDEYSRETIAGLEYNLKREKEKV